MLSRRSFIVSLAGAAPLLSPRVRSRTHAPRVLRVATIVDPARADFALGLRFGAAEADRSAALFGWRVEQVESAPGAPLAADISALVIASDAPVRAPGPLVLLATCRHDVSGFRLLPDAACETTHDDALLWHASLRAFGAEQLNARYRTDRHADMTSDAWLAWFSMKLLAEAALRARSSDPRALADYLRRPTTQFDGHKGVPLRFDAHDVLRQPVYRVLHGASGDSVVATLP